MFIIALKLAKKKLQIFILLKQICFLFCVKTNVYVAETIESFRETN